jgi:plastocyanin
VGLRDTADSEAVSRSMLTVPVAPASAALMPTAPTDGVLTMVIPPGAAADQKVGGRGYQMPDVIQLTAGDTIILRNDDTAPHMILYAFLMPGETHERTFTTPGSEVYSSGCGVHAASFLNFTTIFVGE